MASPLHNPLKCPREFANRVKESQATLVTLIASTSMINIKTLTKYKVNIKKKCTPKLDFTKMILSQHQELKQCTKIFYLRMKSSY